MVTLFCDVYFTGGSIITKYFTYKWLLTSLDAMVLSFVY